MNESELQKLKLYYKIYVNKPKYVFKSCQKDWIVVLEKIEDTITNENRQADIYDYDFATFRGSHFKVASIINKFTLEPVYTITNSCFLKSTVTYVVGEIVCADIFDPHSNNVISNGIHYFLSIDQAFYYELDTKGDYNGKFVEWFANGKLRCARFYVDGIKFGQSIEINEWNKMTIIAYFYKKKEEAIFKEIYLENNVVYTANENIF